MKLIDVVVKPRSSQNEVKLDKGKNAYVVSVKAAPGKGKANMGVIKVLSRHFGKRVEIVRGFTSRNKVIKILD